MRKVLLFKVPIGTDVLGNPPHIVLIRGVLEIVVVGHLIDSFDLASVSGSVENLFGLFLAVRLGHAAHDLLTFFRLGHLWE